MEASRSPSLSLFLGTEEDSPQSAVRRPEIRLWFHVLRRQIWDFVLYRNAPEGTEWYTYAEDAAGWIWWDGEEEVDEAGRPTFRHVCDMLDVDPDRVRRSILALERDDIARLNNQIKES